MPDSAFQSFKSFDLTGSQRRTPLPGLTIIWVTIVGLVVNIGTALLFAKGRSDLNIRGAFLPMLADTGVTFGVLLSGVAILLARIGSIRQSVY